LERRISEASGGSGCAILLTGEPGVGKSTLVREVAADARGLMVLSGRGVESEASLGFAVLADICRPLLGLLERIPEPQAAALSGALALGPAAAFDRFAAYTGALSLMAAVAEREPVLAWVDDAHWLDVESAQALAFCARRIYAEPIALVMVARAAEPLPFASDAFEPLALSGLDREASIELLGAVTGAAPRRSVAERLWAATAGNPLAMIELASLLSEAQLRGRAPLEEPLRVGAGVERLFWRQIAHQSESVQKALMVTAASDTGSVQEIAPALEAFDLAIGDLEPAETAELVTIAAGRIEFKHPLMRAVAYSAASASERRAAHRALADAATGHEATLRRAWHRASATAGVDEGVAQELELAARSMATRTGFAAATSALERAATLSESPRTRAERLLAAGHTAFLAGLLPRARAAADAAFGCADDAVLQAACINVRALVESHSGDVLDAHRMVLEAAARVAQYDRAYEAKILAGSAVPLIIAGRVGSAREVAERAHRLAATVGGAVELRARRWLGLSMILSGETEGYELMLEGLELEAQSAVDFDRQLIVQWGVLCCVWREDYERARAVSSALLSRLRAGSALGNMQFALHVLSQLEFRVGRWAAALAAADEALGIAAETGLAPYAVAFLAAVEGPMGREEAARKHAQQALDLAADTHAGSEEMYARAALGLLELGLSRPDAACAHLAPLAEFTHEQGIAEPGAVWWQPDWIEANIRLRHLDVAKQALTRFEHEATKVNRLWARAAASRCHGLTAPDDEFERHFEQALTLHSLTPTPFEQARTQLCLGQRLRRAGERRRSREQLTLALETFRRLGAEPWALHAERELSTTGATRARTADAAADRPAQELLTPQELHIALAVSEGKSNKQIAADLFLSPKTIEFHLGHIYRKLDIRSRTQLALKMLTA
jgi:DNA-binding CsgD family transcriptional regulator